MPLRYEVGETFPSMALVDDRGKKVTIEEAAGSQPIIVAFYRGPW